VDFSHGSTSILTQTIPDVFGSGLPGFFTGDAVRLHWLKAAERKWLLSSLIERLHIML
jgi:hypothetical protein